MAKLTKDFLLRALVTKICQERQLPELRYETFFYVNYGKLIQKLKARKDDLPSLSYLQATYGFEATDIDFNWKDIVDELDAYYFKEKFIKIAEDAIANANGNEIEIVSQLDDIQTKLSETRRAVTKTKVYDLAHDVDDIADEYERVAQDGVEIVTGFDEFDKQVSLRTGNLVIVLAATGGGKSITMTKMQAEMMDRGIPSIFFSLEMGLVEMTNRLLTASGKHKFNDLHFHRIDKEEYRKSIASLHKTPTQIITRQTEGKIDVNTIERFVVEHHPKVVFVDYLTLIDGADMSWSAEISVTAQLKKIALQHNCLIITAAQADSESLKSGEIPELVNIRGNKGFSFDADIVLALASQRIEMGETKMKIRYAVRKSRNGGYTMFAYRVNPNSGDWNECTGESF